MIAISRVQPRRFNRINTKRRVIRPVDMPDDMKPLTSQEIQDTMCTLFSQLPEASQIMVLAKITAELGFQL